MRYYIENNTLFIRGSFRATGTVISGDIRSVSTIFYHSISPERAGTTPEKELEIVAARAGLGRDYVGLITPVPIQNLCVLQYDFITVFITAGIRSGTGGDFTTINILTCSSQGMSDGELREMIMVATKAGSEALNGFKNGISGTHTDAIIAACEGQAGQRDAGRFTETGKRVYSAVRYGIPEALKRFGVATQRNRPSFFIFSRFKGEHWINWTPEDCPYYPCHFAGQRCDFCYCPLYPCRDESLGQWVESSNKRNVWNCSQCTLLHEPEVAEYLKQHPDALKDELVRFLTLKKRSL
ncbi:MAG: adenosylcobinamide amidohydrolase [Methanoregula sp.]|nr:adenosylcobinamide amidohydrolase [Methanoregula sp.]